MASVTNDPPQFGWVLSVLPDTIQDVWLWFDHRWPIELSIRFRLRRLYGTLPAFQASKRCDHRSWLTELAYWQLFLARDLVRDRLLPWQKA